MTHAGELRLFGSPYDIRKSATVMDALTRKSEPD